MEGSSFDTTGHTLIATQSTTITYIASVYNILCHFRMFHILLLLLINNGLVKLIFMTTTVTSYHLSSVAYMSNRIEYIEKERNLLLLLSRFSGGEEMKHPKIYPHSGKTKNPMVWVGLELSISCLNNYPLTHYCSKYYSLSIIGVSSLLLILILSLPMGLIPNGRQ